MLPPGYGIDVSSSGGDVPGGEELTLWASCIGPGMAIERAILTGFLCGVRLWVRSSNLFRLNQISTSSEEDEPDQRMRQESEQVSKGNLEATDRHFSRALRFWNLGKKRNGSAQDDRSKILGFVLCLEIIMKATICNWNCLHACVPSKYLLVCWRFIKQNDQDDFDDAEVVYAA